MHVEHLADQTGFIDELGRRRHAERRFPPDPRRLVRLTGGTVASIAA